MTIGGISRRADLGGQIDFSGLENYHEARIYPPTRKATVSQIVDECGEGTLRSSEGA